MLTHVQGQILTAFYVRKNMFWFCCACERKFKAYIKGFNGLTWIYDWLKKSSCSIKYIWKLQAGDADVPFLLISPNQNATAMVSDETKAERLSEELQV